MSPSRPRSHEVATESERAFAYLLPSSWVIRKQDDDYGIDAEVEIFEDGRTTGMTFKVQLKGTDTGRRCRSIRVDTLEYWHSLDVPVLVVYYESVTEQLYGQWAHAHDRHVHVRERKPNPKSTAFRFADDDTLTRDNLRTRLCEDVQRFRDIRNGSLAEPLTYSVEFIEVPHARRHHHALRRLLDAAPLRMSQTPADVAVLRAKCSPTELRVTGPVGLASLTVHIDLDLNPERCAADIVAAMGFVLATLGVDTHAANLFVGAGETRLLHTFEVVTAAGICLSTTSRHADAITLSTPLIRHSDPIVRDAGTLLLALAITGNMVSDSVSEDLLRLDHDLIEIEIAQDERGRAGVAYYNFDEHLGATGKYELALAAYTATAHYNTQYLDFDYYHRELGGLHWIFGHYEIAASAYRKALQSGGDPSHLIPLLADSLLHSGRYRETLDLLADWEPAGSQPSALAELVGVVADLVVRTTGLSQQVRREQVPDESIPLSDPWLCRQRLIDIDALDPRYWLGATDTLLDEDELAFAVLLAHLSGDSRIWASATCTAYRLGSPLVSDLAEQAYRRCGEAYLDVLAFLAESDDAVEPWFDLGTDEIAALVDDVYRQLATRPDSRTSPVLRLIPPTLKDPDNADQAARSD